MASEKVYKRILLKLSGEALTGDEAFGIDPKVLDQLALEVGQLVGIGSLLINDAPGPGTGAFGNMFIPVEVLKPVLEQLIAKGRTRAPAKPWLGVYTQEMEGQLVISKLAVDGPGERAGLRRGEIILGVDGHKVTGMIDFFRKVRARGDAGAEVPLDILSPDPAADIAVRKVAIRSADRHGWLKLED